MTAKNEEVHLPNRAAAGIWSPSSKSVLYHRRVGRVFSRTKDLLRKLYALEKLDSETRENIRQPLRSHLLQVVATSWGKEDFMDFSYPYIYRAMMGLYLATPFLVNLQVKASYSIIEWIAIYILQVFVFLILFAIFLLFFTLIALVVNLTNKFLFSLDRKSTRFDLFLYILGPIPILILSILLFANLIWGPRANQPTLTFFALMSGLLAAVLIEVVYTMLIIMIVIRPGFARRQTSARHPQSVVASDLLEIQFEVETQPGRWRETDFKQNLLSKLENTARCLEHDLPRRLISGDAGTDDWLNKAAQEMAAALREKKKWILTPKPDSRERLLESLKTDFLSAVTGNWDSFERAEPAPFSRTQFIYQAVDFMQTLIRGALPLLILLLIQQTSLALGDKAADTAMLVALGWLVLSLLFRVDPLSKDKLEALEKVKTLFPW